ncbi:protein SRG1-like [Papaver somniferum]|uniref:protein SRG1-like n=2 Tax=Papaver somniferum TaxID=3469 RepID=UPI000E6FBA35|nr:protein SRG1-like [Papaver somniferum]
MLLFSDHEVSSSTVEKIKLETHNFFELPVEEKKKLWQKPGDFGGFGQVFVVSDKQKLDWSDMFGITMLPTIMRKPHLFTGIPLSLREALEEYALGLKKLTINILEQMDSNEMRELFSECCQAMRMNYYPPCPKAEQVLGFSPHSDADALMILLQLNETEGLQIRKDGKWLPVKPIHNAFVVNIRESVSNGVYRSIEHRAVVNSTKERLSVGKSTT